MPGTGSLRTICFLKKNRTDEWPSVSRKAQELFFLFLDKNIFHVFPFFFSKWQLGCFFKKALDL